MHKENLQYVKTQKNIKTHSTTKLETMELWHSVIPIIILKTYDSDFTNPLTAWKNYLVK